MSPSNGAEPRYASINDRESQAPELCMEQPGLEVAAQRQNDAADWSGLQITQAPSEYQQVPGKEAVSFGKSEKIPVVEDHAVAEVEGVGKTPPTLTPKAKRRFLIAGAIFLLVALGAVVGGFTASREAKASWNRVWGTSPTGDSGTAEPTGTSTTNSTTNSLPIKQGPPLTVTGWRKEMGVEIFLFYLNTENVIQRSTLTSTSTSTGTSKKSWGTTTKKYSSFVSGSSRLSGTIIQYGDGYQPQTELFYTNEDNRLIGLSFNDKYSPVYQEDSIKNMLLATGTNSSVSTYWPWATFQGSDGRLWEVRNRLREEFSPAAEWDAKKLDIIAADASRLALVPLATNFSQIATKGGYGIVYQDENNRLAVFMPDFRLNSDELGTYYAASWPTDFLSVTLPDHGVFAAFSVARPSDSLGRVNTYILYVDASSNINVAYTEDSSSWLISRPSALQNVDPDTDITCLTMATTYRDSSQSEVPLMDASWKLARCYFQKGGLLREMVFDGTDWVHFGNVPVS
ncbi:hypothetical protein CkaCkLH20_09728 [Colletotrichum karsti]|uniref:Fucose-specific lectin n=1 Tax=Colletotrichum karsti TaxID=1095194 RepID=A0A9P6LHR6_9PEZI|nr:uncharacterized protein CkaCkLH20_09728 [Colletotrichum karsti]KAF9872865.1 hypothetical protein CkaCkLH20_09728 [Colletotrichum karsti]